MATFALLHGAWHGGWHWHAVAEVLEEQGHRVVAPDLPIDRPGAGVGAWAEVVRDALDGDRGAVVVAHSLGGLALPVAAEAVDASRMVFIAGFVPVLGATASDTVPGRALTQRFASLTTRLQVFDDGSTAWASLTDAAETMYDELPRGVALVAASHLRRQYYGIWDEVCPLAAWPEIPSSYVVCRNDLVVSPAWQREVARRQLGVEPLVLPGGYAPFLARPAELAELLVIVGLQVEAPAAD